MTHRYRGGRDEEKGTKQTGTIRNRYRHFDILKITACLQPSVDNLRFWEDVVPYRQSFLSVAFFAPDWQSDSCQREIKMVGVKKAVKSPPKCQVPVLLLLVTS